MSFLLLLLMLDDNLVWSVNGEDLSEVVVSMHTAVVTETGDVFILDRDAHRIVHLGPDGKERNAFGRSGEGPGEMQRPHKLVYHAKLKLLAVHDWRNPDLILFEPSGKLHTLKISRDNDPHILDKNRIAFIKTESVWEGHLNKGAKVTVLNKPSDEELILKLYNSDHHEDPKVVKDKAGAGAFSFEWSLRALLATDMHASRMVTTSNLSLDAQVIDAKTLKPLFKIIDKDIVRHELTREEIEENPRFIILGDKKFSSLDLEHPDYKPALDWIKLDADARVWVGLTQKFGGTTQEIRVYGAEAGKPLGKMEIPAGATWIHADKDHLWLAVSDPETDERILEKRRYQLK